MAIDRTSLIGRWTHSHEEDDPGKMVFRLRGWNFPPSRGRRSFQLRPDGSLQSGGPGPDDRSREASGQWRLLPGDILELDEPSGPVRFHLVEASPDKLVVRRP